jgi:hypothetical protein
MRYLFLFLVTELIYTSCLSQSSSKAWLPLDYVIAVSEQEPLANNYLIPIEGFELINDTLHILMYKGELHSLNFNINITKDNEKHQLLNLQYQINLKYNNREIIDKIEKSKVYLYKSKNKIIVEFVNDDQKEKIIFTDRLNNYQFTSITKSEEKLSKL